jgi:maf-like protein
MNVANAQQMLADLSGKRIEFYSAIVLLNTATGKVQHHVDHTVVTMRQLTQGQISRYLEREPDAVYCAGAAKSEGLGAALLERIESTDPNALIGLPIFRLIDFLKNEGVEVL